MFNVQAGLPDMALPVTGRGRTTRAALQMRDTFSSQGWLPFNISDNYRQRKSWKKSVDASRVSMEFSANMI
jgi:hypothetical protein